MKKIILFSLMLALIVFSAIAQNCPPPCDEPWVYKEKHVPLCPFDFINVGEPNVVIHHPNPVTLELTWREKTCDDGNTYIQIHSIIVYTSMYNFDYDVAQGTIEYVPSTYNPYSCLDLALHPRNPNDEVGWRAYFDFLKNKYKPVGLYNSPNMISTPGKCEELVQVMWPAGAGFFQPMGDLPGGGTASPIFVPLTALFTLAPCGDICCISHHEPATPTTPGISNCESRQRDPNFAPTKGTFTGTIVSAFGCKPSCANHTNTSSFTTGLNSVSKELKLEANPTLVNDKIYFTSEETIKQAIVFDAKGKKVMEQSLNEPELNLSELKAGIYYVQIKFDNKEVRTIKIYKN